MTLSCQLQPEDFFISSGFGVIGDEVETDPKRAGFAKIDQRLHSQRHFTVVLVNHPLQLIMKYSHASQDDVMFLDALYMAI